MIDMVEARVIAGQIADHLLGKRIASADLAERKKKSYRDAFLLRVKPEAFRERLEGTVLTDAYAKHRHVCLETDGGAGIDIGDVYGRILYIAPGAKAPGNPPISLSFDDGSRLIVLAGVWGVMRLTEIDELRAYRDASIPDILDATSEAFTVEALRGLIAMDVFKKQTVKQVLTKHGRPGIMGLMGAYSQETLYRASIHPKRQAQALSDAELVALHGAIRGVVGDAIAAGGRASERDLFDRPGGWAPTVSSATEGTPCPACGALIAEIKLGGGGKYYYCPGCQVL